mmetsp:Transcript_9650/g.18159  ORF Transcript_9650/g.18159 Transcript_9650/m.18159 type:complete len:1426 (-) Transcript_9650:410-4687(-)
MDAFQLVPGKDVYAQDETGVWTVATLERLDKTSATVSGRDGSKWSLALTEILPFSGMASQGIDDMILLDVLNEAAILTNIQSRYAQQHIYTYVGPILLSVNPYQSLPVYGSDVLARYVDSRSKDANPPHLYQVAEAAFGNVLRRGQNQAVLISGESGAGKTEATKVVLHYLTQRSHQLCALQGSASDEGSVIQQRILDANPVLEAFGNATTIRNTNSSRFGKLFQVQYNDYGLIVGARLTKYLLEKSRVVSQAVNERNYHIFYQLCAGATEQERRTLGLQGASCYHYLSQNGRDVCVDGLNDNEGFQKVRNGLRVLGINDGEQSAMWRLVAAILHLGNLCFVCNERTGETYVDPSASSYLDWVALLLDCESKQLQQALCFRTMSSGRTAGKASVYQIPLNLEKCLDSRDALAKHLYSLLFDWLVDRVNQSMENPTEAKCSIGVLDIFGFEVFENNCFEQLCINYANEKLHQQFINFFFRSEQEAYVDEDIPWEKVEFADNVECLNLLEGKPYGIFSLLQEQCQMGRNMDDAKLVDLFQSHLHKHPDFSTAKFSPSSFVVKHYAGDVSYNSDGFLEKNKDSLHDDLQAVLTSSKCPFITRLVAGQTQSSNPPASTSNPKTPGPVPAPRKGGPKGSVLSTTLSMQFMQQVDTLMNLLSSCDLHYVRCIKPNDHKCPSHFAGKMVLSQLKYSGVLECIKLRRAGFAVRVKFEEVTDMFKSVRAVRDASSRGVPQSDKKERCRRLLLHLGVPEDAFLLGKTLCFFKYQETMVTIYSKLDEVKHAMATRIQAVARGHLQRGSYLRACYLLVRMQARARGVIQRHRGRRALLAAHTVQRYWRKLRMLRLLHRMVVKKRESDERLKHVQGGITAKIQEEELKRQQRMAARGISTTPTPASVSHRQPPPPPSRQPPPPPRSQSIAGKSSSQSAGGASPRSASKSSHGATAVGSGLRSSVSGLSHTFSDAAKQIAARAEAGVATLTGAKSSSAPTQKTDTGATKMEGYAWKKGGSKMGKGGSKAHVLASRNTWRRRYFVLTADGCLRYYVERNDPASFKGEVVLSAKPWTVEARHHTSNRLGHMEHCLVLTQHYAPYHAKPFMMSVDNATQARDWLYAIVSVVGSERCTVLGANSLPPPPVSHAGLGASNVTADADAVFGRQCSLERQTNAAKSLLAAGSNNANLDASGHWTVIKPPVGAVEDNALMKTDVARRVVPGDDAGGELRTASTPEVIAEKPHVDGAATTTEQCTSQVDESGTLKEKQLQHSENPRMAFSLKESTARSFASTESPEIAQHANAGAALEVTSESHGEASFNRVPSKANPASSDTDSNHSWVNTQAATTIKAAGALNALPKGKGQPPPPPVKRTQPPPPPGNRGQIPPPPRGQPPPPPMNASRAVSQSADASTCRPETSSGAKSGKQSKFASHPTPQVTA